jgi:UPF0716 protein FxsA
MLQLFVLIFLILPIVELTLLFKLGNWIGWVPTLAVVLGAGMAGAAVARVEGWRAAMRVRQQLAHGVLPAAEMFDGLLIAAAGVLLVIPGVVSDVLGLLLLLPPTRKLVRRWLMHVVRTRFRVQLIRDGSPTDEGGGYSGDQIIDARVIETRVVD